MKRILTCLLALTMLLSCAAYAASNGDFVRVCGCEEYVTLREQPSTGAARIMQIPLGAQVIYKGPAGNGFTKVYFGGYDGYVLSEYLSRLDPMTGEEYNVPMYVANCNKYISQRSEPAIDMEVLQRIPLGAEVMSYGRVGEFLQENPMEEVHYQGKNGSLRGYALSRYLCFLPPETDSCALISATLRMNDEDGVLTQQTVTNPASLKELEGMIRRATPTILTKCPMAAQLELELANGDKLRFAYPIDGCATLIAENQSVYTLTSASGSSSM
ncbi:MAG: SH3 domain-containing protein [Aristaeellaceae bacterium]